MGREAVCPKCRGKMQAGIIPDMGYGKVWLARWQAGEATRGLLGGLKMKGKLRYEIEAERCASCGFIELYARKTER